MIKKLICFLLLLTGSYGATASSTGLDDKLHVLALLTEKVQQEYIMTEHLSAITEMLSKLEVSEQIKQVSTNQEFAKLLSDELQKFDGHLGLIWQNPSPNSSTSHESWFSKLARSNSGFNKVEVLKGNIGYIDFWGFDNINEASKRKAEAVMTMVEDTDAIIFDLRNNGGGDAAMIQFISSYFFEKPTHLNSFKSRKGGEPVEFWSYKNVNGKKMLTTPVYLLTSKRTFSAAEEFAYNLKHLGRGTIIGEKTRGGANPVYYFNLGHGFKASIPISKAVNPITGTNWEAVGVKPHYHVASESAFTKAYIKALKKVKMAAVDPFQIKEIDMQLSDIGCTKKHNN
jgi:hypothetical protein